MQTETQSVDAAPPDDLVVQAETAAAEAESAAREARQRATELRRRIEESQSESLSADEPPAPDGPATRRRSWRATAWPRRIAVATSLVVTAALFGASGYMLWQHHRAQQVEQARAEFTAAARQNVVNLMSIDFTDPTDDVRRIVDSSTGDFRDDFEYAAEDFVKVAEDAQVTTTATVDSAVVESMSGDTAVVLVTADSTITNAAGAKEEPRRWRLSVDLQRDGDQIKMSKVEFVP
ncbi:hypothetical protein H7J07_03025 [Mycobacterium koreense]|uniref:Mce associated membrane protein n=1 Tax=Mycolicibacillus koreensis TaxID=1069220 RepID=A0AA91PF72_9MYCO|nr:hypothetical protein [Mycolicibacillus koreensis]MCV7247231.1 hypothetical protein [Mycolicibacillus koreensis]ODR06659.1 hypothetical protein BHQ15_12540 [Mycolicibacillus koreensis]OSC34248.1 hypothetical protein B8W67_07870 [Mycolicibacillus koreensis]